MWKRTLRAAVLAAGMAAASAASIARAGVLDLTAAPYSGAVNGVVFEKYSELAAGSGHFDAFVRINARGSRTVAEGYNTDARPVQFDENAGPEFTHALRLDQVPVVDWGGAAYREFRLDLNEPNGGGRELVSLDQLQVFLGPAGNLSGYPDGLGTLIYGMNAPGGEDNSVKLDASFAGSGQSDARVLVPESLFASAGGSNPYIYLYSRFGEHDAADGGYEEWGASDTGSINVPEPATLVLLAAGCMLASRWHLRTLRQLPCRPRFRRPARPAPLS